MIINLGFSWGILAKCDLLVDSDWEVKYKILVNRIHRLQLSVIHKLLSRCSPILNIRIYHWKIVFCNMMHVYRNEYPQKKQITEI
jgi:hypothetical protein